MNIWKRTLSVGLSLVLCGSMVMPSFAAACLNDRTEDGGYRYIGSDGSLLSHKEDNEAGETFDSYDYYLKEDLVLDKTLNINDGVNASIDLNGHDLVLNEGLDTEQIDKLVYGKPVEGAEKWGPVVAVKKGVTTGASLEVYGNKEEKDADVETGEAYEKGEGEGSITGGVSDFGGGVMVDGGSSFTMTGGAIKNNVATGHGGAVVNAGNLTLDGVTVADNKAGNHTGGVYGNPGGWNIGESTITIKDCVFENNTCGVQGDPQGWNGSAVNTAGSGRLDISGTVFQNNKGGVSVIMMYCDGTIKDSKIINNDGKNISNNSQIKGNTGHTVLWLLGPATVENCVIQDNTNFGRGIWDEKSKATIKNSIVCGNPSALSGNNPQKYQVVVGYKDTGAMHTEENVATWEENEELRVVPNEENDGVGKMVFECDHCQTQHEVPLYLVTVDGNGSKEEFDPQVVVGGGSPEKPGDPTREDYKFDGWVVVTTDPETGDEVETPFNPEDPVEGPVVIRAKWTYTPDNPGSGSGATDIDDPDVPLGGGPELTTIEDEAVPLAGLFTRADAIGYLWVQSGRPEAELSTFEDVPEDHEWAVAIGWAQDMGIAVADEAGNFRPDDLVLRWTEDLELDPEGEFEEFLNRYAEYAGVELEAGELFVELGGEPDDIVMGEDAQVIFDNFFARLEEALAGQAA